MPSKLFIALLVMAVLALALVGVVRGLFTTNGRSSR
jgi:hypothetical protein